MSAQFNLYDLTVPVLSRALTQLLNILKKGEEWAAANNVDKQTLIDGKLAEDMLPLPFQIQSACNAAKLGLARVGGEENVPVEDKEKTFEEFYARINHTLDLLKAASRDKFLAPETRITVKLGPSERKFTAVGYVQKFLLPNFFFHHTTAYMILRNKGVDVGKLIYLGATDIEDQE